MEALFLEGDGATADDAVGPLPTLPVPVNYPQWASLALLPLQGPDYQTQVGLCLARIPGLWQSTSTSNP